MSENISGEPQIPRPNYTQIPNIFFDEILPSIKSLAESKVTIAVMRQTFGFHKKCDLLSKSRLVALTGLSPASVSEGIKLALERGTLCRKASGNSFLYAVRLQALKVESKPVQNLDIGKNLDSPESIPKPVQNLDSSGGKNSPEFSHTKESNSKEKKESTAAATAAHSKPSRNPSKKKPTGLPKDHPVRLEVARAWMKDLDSPATLKGEYSQIANVTQRFVSMGETPQTIREVEACWYAYEFRGTKGEPPSPPDLLATYQKMKAGKYTGQANGNPHHNQSEHKSVTNFKRSLVY